MSVLHAFAIGLLAVTVVLCFAALYLALAGGPSTGNGRSPPFRQIPPQSRGNQTPWRYIPPEDSQ